MSNAYTIEFRRGPTWHRVRYVAVDEGHRREEEYHNGCRWVTRGSEHVDDLSVDGPEVVA